MENKEIYINGVDVSGCCCYENDRCLWAKRYYENNIVPDCKKVKDCYYKQLKRKEQECERLKHDNGYEVGALEKTIENIKAENERLEVHSATLDAVIETGRVQYKALKQTLTEIKEIAEKQCVCGVDCIDMKQILQKISEVENEHNG